LFSVLEETERARWWRGAGPSPSLLLHEVKRRRREGRVVAVIP